MTLFTDNAADLNKRARWAAVAAVLAGLALVAWLPSGGLDKEHWDHELYWPTVYPLLCAAAAVLALWSPRRAWLPGLLVMLAQGVPLLVRHWQAELFAVSLGMLVLISLPPMIAGVVGAAIGRRARAGSAPRP